MIATDPILVPHGPWKSHVGQWYATDWSRQRAQRPILVLPQLGHPKTVAPLPMRTAPQEEQRDSAGLTDARKERGL
ncbi:MAG: hypothetical protein A3K66_07680 [Euryarchaeota archaeon RBG_16_67_27]|nr:MAG: hypothetical protein A3K66_07680 [Euryarchaeota archaeon RBG_16_67_27]